MDRIRASVVLNVNSAAFSGEDMDLMEPTWEIKDKYNYKCEKEFRSSYSGPGSWFLDIVLTGAGFCIATTAKSYLNELGKDLYKWSKECLKPVFAKNQKGDGCIMFSYHNKKIYVDIENPASDHFEEIWLEFPQIIEIIKKHPWRTEIGCDARWDEESKRWNLKISDVDSKIRLKNICHRCKWFLKNIFYRFPHDNYMIASSVLTFLLSTIFYLIIFFLLI